MIHKADRFEKKINGHKQTVYLFGDIHIPFAQSVLQRQLLCTQLTQLDPNSSLVVVEDALDYDTSHPQITAYMKTFVPVLSQTTPLNGFAQVCRNLKIPVVNIEYRQSLFSCNLWNYYLYHSKMSSQNLLDYLCLPYDILIQEIINQLDNQIDQIRSYDDGPVLNNYYTKIINNFLTKHEAFLNSLRAFAQNNSQATVKDYIDSCYPDEQNSARYTCASKLKTWDIQLLDLQALHTIAQSNDKKTIIIFMGSLHTDRIASLLPELGYTLVKKFGREFFTEKEKTDDIEIDFNNLTLDRITIANEEKTAKKIRQIDIINIPFMFNDQPVARPGIINKIKQIYATVYYWCINLFR